MRDAPARGLHAGPGRSSGLPGEILDHVSQGLESVAHELVHPVVQTGPLALPIGIREGPGALFERPSVSPDGCLHGLTTGRLPRLQSKLSCAKESDPLRERSALALEDRELVCKGVDLHDVWDGFFCQ